MSLVPGTIVPVPVVYGRQLPSGFSPLITPAVMSIGARGFASPRRIRPSAGAANTARRTPATKTSNPNKMHRFKNADCELNFLLIGSATLARRLSTLLLGSEEPCQAPGILNREVTRTEGQDSLKCFARWTNPADRQRVLLPKREFLMQARVSDPPQAGYS
jgi:hypothetical protein